MKTHRILSILFLALFTTAFVGGNQRPLTPDKTEEVRLLLLGDVISVDEGKNELSNPAVAYSDKTNHYLVVYEDNVNGGIKGRFINASTGNTTGDDFEIVNHEPEEFSPDVAYDQTHDVFLVVYSTLTHLQVPPGAEYEIKGIIVEEPDLNGAKVVEEPSGPNEFTISSVIPSYFQEVPKVEYNWYDDQYMVVFLGNGFDENGWHELRGQMLSGHSELPVRLGPDDGFFIYGTTGSYESPDLAWGIGSDSFLAVVQQNDKRNSFIATRRNIEGILLHDTYQSSGSQRLYEFSVAPNDPLTQSCHSPRVAYETDTWEYTVAFEYGKVDEDAVGMTVYKQVVASIFNPDTGPLLLEPEPIADDLTMYTGYYSPVISYSGIDDVMHVAYKAKLSRPGPNNDDNSILVQELNRMSSGPATQLRSTETGDSFYSMAIASSTPGKSIVVWGEEVNSPKNEDLFAQQIGRYNVTYLPSIFKK